MDLLRMQSNYGVLDLPEEIINEIILLVPLIDLFRVSKVCHVFQTLAYKRRKEINTREAYQKAASEGDILALLSCTMSYINFGFHEACRAGYIEIVKLLIYKTKSYWGRAKDWNEGLQGACFGGHMNIVQLMIYKGANDWNQGLYDACLGGHIKIILFMISIGERFFSGVNNWNYSFYGACIGKSFKDKKEIFQLLISKGATECYCGSSINEHY